MTAVRARQTLRIISSCSAQFKRPSSLRTMTFSSSSRNTPILPCLDYSSINIHPSSSSRHPFDSLIFDIPPSIKSHLSEAASHLQAGRTVALPTETVYGLAASSLNPEAVQRIYKIKNRPSDNPLIIHISSLNMLRSLLPPSPSYTLSPLYLALIDAFWPGPLSLLFPSPNPPPLPAPQTNAIRMPSHPLALALIHHSNLPLSAPSANSSGRPSPTCAAHVYNDLNKAEGLGCILDGGPCGVGVESTVVNGLQWKEGGGGSVDVLRPGGLGVEEIARIVRQVDGGQEITQILLHGKLWRGHEVAPLSNGNGSVEQQEGKETIRSTISLPPSTPGMKYRHYSPRVPVFLLKPSNIFQRPSTLSRETGAESSAQAVLRQIAARLPVKAKGSSKSKVGLLHFAKSPLSQQIASASMSNESESKVEIVPISLGDSAASAAQRLFAGMLKLEGRHSLSESVDEGETEPEKGVEAILIEGCTDDGLGLAVMERVNKAVGGGGVSGDLANGDKSRGAEGSSNTFWVNVNVDID